MARVRDALGLGATAFRSRAFVDVSAQLLAGATGSAAANAAVIQAAIVAANVTVTGPNVVAINTPGVYYVNQIVMYSNTSLLLGMGVTLRKPANTVAAMFINYGATQVSPISDTDIGFYGQGTIDGNAANQSILTAANNGVITSNTFSYGIQGEVAMINVTNFVFALENVYNCNGFVIQYTGTKARFENINVNTARDFIHINGPSSHISIDNCAGFTSDAFIALNAWDWHRSGPTVGDITDVRITKCAYYGSNGLSVNGAAQNRTSGMVIFLPGTRSTGSGTGVGNVRNVTVDGFTVDMTQGSVTPSSAAFQPSQVKDTLQGSEYSGVGLIENVWIGNGYCAVPNSNCALVTLVSSGLTADAQCTTTVRNLIVENVHSDASVGTTGNSINTAPSAFNFWYVENYSFVNCQWTPNNGSASQTFINWATKTPADSITIDGLTINANTATSFTAAFLSNQYSAGNASTVNDLTLNRIRTAPNHQITAAWFLVNGIVTNFRSRGNYLVGSGSGSDIQGIMLSATTAKIVNGVVSDSYFNGTKALLTITSAASGVAATLAFNNCQLNNVTHPVYLSGAFNADVSFNGGSINTGANLARVATGALVASYRDVQSSGAGAATITLVTAGTVELRNTDRIAFNPAIVLTPANNDVVNFSGTPAYAGVNVVSGTGAGLYVYRGTGTVGWVKLN